MAVLAENNTKVGFVQNPVAFVQDFLAARPYF